MGWVHTGQSIIYHLRSSKDGTSSDSSGDTVWESAHWENYSKAQRKSWRETTNQILNENHFYEALGMMGGDTKKPTKPTSVESVKMPPLDPPTWLNEVAHDLLADEAPHVGPQVS
jgi:hypothetical protein